MTARLAGRTTLVTGSTTGIGVAVARRFAAEGAHVLVSGRDAGRGADVVEEITTAGGRAQFLQADLGGDPADVLALAERALAIAPIDVLVNNAAQLLMPAPTADVPADLIDSALRTNIRAPFLLTGAIAPTMAAAGGGAIVNVGSINGLIGSAQSALYSMTKAALHSLTKSWAAEFAASNVRVNTVAPGPTLTPRNETIREHLDPIVAAIPSRRFSTVDEVAAAVLFLAGDEALNIHGATLSVDGGWAAA